MDASPDPGACPASSAEVVELRIDALAAGGDGVGRTGDGCVVFVAGTAPGDLVRARITSRRARYARAELEALLEPGPGRVTPVCEAFGECGGCSWQHVDYAVQCEAKRRIVEDALRRLGRLAPPEVRLHPSPTPYAYRGRARVLVRAGQVGYRRRRSHALCPVRRCPILTPPAEAALRRLVEAPPDRDGEWEIVAGAEDVAVHPVRGAGEAVELTVEGTGLRVSPGVFQQGHPGLHAALLDAVTRAAGTGVLALELYAGAGFFTLPLSRAFAHVVAIEAHSAAARDLRRNVARAGAEGVRVVRARVETALAADPPLAPRPDAVVLDPPRSGLAPGAAESLAALAPRRIVYLSCDPATLARDLAVLVARDFALGDVLAFDLFPQTPHVEVLATLHAEEGRDARAGYTPEDPGL